MAIIIHNIASNDLPIANERSSQIEQLSLLFLYPPHVPKNAGNPNLHAYKESPI